MEIRRGKNHLGSVGIPPGPSRETNYDPSSLVFRPVRICFSIVHELRSATDFPASFRPARCICSIVFSARPSGFSSVRAHAARSLPITSAPFTPRILATRTAAEKATSGVPVPRERALVFEKRSKLRPFRLHADTRARGPVDRGGPISRFRSDAIRFGPAFDREAASSALLELGSPATAIET